MCKFFKQLPFFNKLCIIVCLVCGVISIVSVFTCALCPNLIVKIVSGVFIGLSVLILIIFAILIQIFN